MNQNFDMCVLIFVSSTVVQCIIQLDSTLNLDPPLPAASRELPKREAAKHKRSFESIL